MQGQEVRVKSALRLNVCVCVCVCVCARVCERVKGGPISVQYSGGCYTAEGSHRAAKALRISVTN